jgi:hypothetical protein
MSQFGVAQAHADANDPRYRPDNVASFELEYVSGIAQPHSSSAANLEVPAAVRAVMGAPSLSSAGAAKGGAADMPDGPPAKQVPRDGPAAAGAGPSAHRSDSGRSKSGKR